MERYDIYPAFQNDEKGKRIINGITYDKGNNGEWVKAEEALAIEAERDALRKEVEALKQANEWRTDWENSENKCVLVKHYRVKPFYIESLHKDEIEVHKSMNCKFKIIEP